MPDPTPVAPAADDIALLQHAVEEAARLLNADGAMVYLVDPQEAKMRFAVDAGIRNAEARSLIRGLTLQVGVGVFGTAVERREVVVTDDYRRDKRFTHSPVADRIVMIANMRSMAAAPLIAEGEVLGALGAYSSQIGDFDEAEIALLRALADHAAAAIFNRRLLERLTLQANELAHRVEAQRTLAEIGAQLSSIREPSSVLRQTLEAAARLLQGDGGQIGLIARDGAGNLRWGDGHSLVHKTIVAFTKEDQTPVDDGVSGRAVREGRTSWTDDYLADSSFPHDAISDDFARKLGIRAVIAAPLVGEDGPMGAIGVYAEHPAAFDADDAELLGLLADQAAVVITNSRLNREAEIAAEGLARGVEAQRSLAEIASTITSLRDPSAVLARTIAEAKRLLQADHLVIHQVRVGTQELADFREAFEAAPDAPPIDDTTISVGQGIAGRAVATGHVTWTGDYLGDTSFPHTDRADAWIERYGYHSQMSAPLIGEAGSVGAISAYAERRDAFDTDDAELLGALASHAAIVLGNAKLYEELEHRVETQRTLGEIAARITAIHDPGDVLQRTLDEAVRLLEGDGGRIELVDPAGGGLHWAFGHSAIDLPIERDESSDPVMLDEGVSGRAVIERRVVRTGDYLADESFSHAEAPDRYIRQHGIRSVISAPLTGENGAIGSLTIHSQARDAFDAGNAELLEVLASQAAIAVTNARLYGQLNERVEAQRRLLQINEGLLSMLDRAGVLELIADGLKGVVWYDYLGVYRVEAEEGVLRPVLARDRNAEAVLGFAIPRGQGVTWWSVEHRQPVLLNDALSDPRVIRIPNTPREEEAIIIVPLISGDEVIGAMNIARRGGAEVAFTDADFELVQLFAGQAAVAITNARLYSELGESERRYRHLVDNSPDIVWSVDAEGRFTFLSDSLESRTGWRPEQLIGKPFTVLAEPGTLAAAEAAWELVRANPHEEQRARLDLPLADGQLSQAEVAMTGTVVDGRFAGAHGSVRDISERERLEGDLRRQAGELAASQERAHLARELHDSVTQALFSMGLTTRSLELLLESDPDRALTKLHELRELQRDALAEMRTLIFELRPASLETDGLAQALRTHAASVQGRTGLAVAVDTPTMDRLPLPVEEALYRIGQEALHNVVKHANAEHATIRLRRTAGRVDLSVEDDGSGFDPEDVPRGHIGLIGMRQRADLVGAELFVESGAGRGTRIKVVVPAE